MPNRRDRMDHIHACDGLRAIALMGVIAFHVWPNKVPGGYFGVNIFFVLAGFFISRKVYYELQWDNQFDLFKYYRKRLMRLYLPLIPLLVAVSLWTYFVQPNVYANVQNSMPSVLLFYNNIYQLMGSHSYFATHGNFQPFMHLWALSLEMQFYLLYPLLILLLQRILGKRWRASGSTLLGLSVLSAVLMAVRYHAGVDPTPIYYSLLCRMFAFTIGGAAAFYYLSTPLAECLQKGISKGIRNLMVVGCLVVIIATYFFMDYQNRFVYQGGMFLYSLLTAFCIILIYPQDLGAARLLSSRFLRSLSQRSYSYYIWQYSLMVLGADWFSFSTTPMAVRHLLHFILLLVIGELSYRLFEQKGISYPKYRRSLVTAGVLILLLMQINLRPIMAENPSRPITPIPGQVTDEHPQPTEPPRPTNPSENNDGELGSPEPKVLQNLRLTVIGDSVLDMAADQLKHCLPECTIDAKISRQIRQGVEILKALNAEGKTGDVILISLGTNGDFKEKVLDQYYQLAGEKPLIFLTTVMPDNWEQSVNDKFRRYAATHHGVYVADWYALAKNHPEWFYRDGTHPKPEGVRQLVRLILQELVSSDLAIDNLDTME